MCVSVYEGQEGKCVLEREGDRTCSERRPRDILDFFSWKINTHIVSLSPTHCLSHTFTDSLSHTHCLSHTHALSFSHTHTVFLSHTLSLSHTHTVSLSCTHCLSLTHTLSFSHTHTVFLSHTLSLSHTHTISLSRLSLSHAHTLFLSCSKWDYIRTYIHNTHVRTNKKQPYHLTKRASPKIPIRRAQF